MTVKNTSTKSAGNVTMTLEAYNELYTKLKAYESAFTVKKGWGTEIEVKVNISEFGELIKEKIELSGYADEYEVYPVGDWYDPNFSVGRKPEPKEEDAEGAEQAAK